eukprot:3000038-Pyramimonas_sp.AAC.1
MNAPFSNVRTSPCTAPRCCRAVGPDEAACSTAPSARPLRWPSASCSGSMECIAPESTSLLCN